MEAQVTLKLTVAELNDIVFALNAAISDEQTLRKGDIGGETRKFSFEREARLTLLRDKLK